MHTFTREPVHKFDLAGGLAIGIELLSGLTSNQGPHEGDAPSQPCGTGLDLVRGEGLFGKSRVLIRRRDGVEDYGDGLADGAEESEGVGDRLQIEDGGTPGDQHQVGRPGSLERRAAGMGRGVEVEHLAAGLAHAADFVRQEWAERTPGRSALRRSDPLEAEAWGLRSITAVLRPVAAEATARCKVRVVFPEPPFWLTMAMLFMRGL